MLQWDFIDKRQFSQEKIQPILILQNTKVNNMCASDDFTCPVNAQIRMLFPIEFPYCMTNRNGSYNYKI